MSVPSPSIGQVFGHYRLLEQIGAGGMGVVFRARDEQLQRDVAVKFLPAGFLSDVSRRDRFRKEALALGRLNHPNVAMAFDFGEESGIDYLVTEYTTGPSLDEKIGKRPLPPKEMLELGIQMMNGLEAAHREGIIHRDLKPNNIRLDRDGKLKILDFGLAEFDSPIDHSAKTESLESSVSGGGTLPYMSPEQLKEEPVDARADIWAAGAVLYETATGKRAFPDRQPSLVIDAILHHDPVRPMLLNPEVIPGLEAVILKALDRDPDRRYQSARELRVDLMRLRAGDEALTASSHNREPAARTTKRRMLATALLFLVAIAMIGLIAKRWWPQQLVQGQKILAVLPIEAVGQDAATNALGLGLTETLTAKLVQASDNDAVQVVSPRDLRDQNVKTAEDARREFGTDYVLESSLQRSGQMLRINCYLVDSRTHRQLSARTIETDAGDTFRLQDEVVNAALDMLPGSINSAQRRALAARQDTQPAAYEAYIRGRGYLQEYEKPENIDNAIAEFNNAIKIDPQYSPAFAALGQAYWIGYDQLNKGAAWLEKAAESCKRAVALNTQLAEAQTCLGNVALAAGKYEEAINKYQNALKLNPDSEDALGQLALAYEKSGNASAAEPAYQQAIALRPNYWAPYNWMGVFYFGQGRYSDAADMFRKVTILAPSNYRGYSNLGAAYINEGRYADAIDAFKRSLDLGPNRDGYINLGAAYFYLHRYSEAAETARKALNLDDHHALTWGNLADALYWAPGRRQEARTAYEHVISLARSQVAVNPRDATMNSYLAEASAMVDDKATAVEYARRAVSLAPEDPDVMIRTARVYCHFGDKKQALAWLERAVKAGGSRANIRDTPDFSDMNSMPEFQKLVSPK